MDAKEVLKILAGALAPFLRTSDEADTARRIALSIMDDLPEGKQAFLAACGVDPFKDSFMKPDIEHAAYYEVETNRGTEIVPADVVGLGIQVGDRLDEDDREDAVKFSDAVALLKDYVEGTNITSIELKEGWMARMSAPGYMDCTDWSVHDSEDEAFQYLVDNYGDSA